MDELAGKVGIVTGAAAGIGRAAAEALAAAGAAVVVADVDEARGEKVAAGIAERGGRAFFVRADVADDASVSALVEHAVDGLGGLDVAFNNAGVEGAAAPIHEMSPETWEQTIAVDLRGVWSCMRHEVPAMLRRGGGSIVNCSSVAGLVGFPGMAAYVAAKHGVVGLTRTVALECATQGIRVNAVCPGVIDTEMVARVVGGQQEVEEGLLASEPVGRMGHPEEIADAVVWLCSDRSSFVTGQAIAVDGGFVAR